MTILLTLGTDTETNEDYPATVEGLVAYWDATVDGNVIRDGDLNVSALLDKGDLAIDLVQPNMSLQPKYAGAGFSGQGTLVFNGSSRCMITNKVLPLSSTAQCTVIICHTSFIGALANGEAQVMCELTTNTNNFTTGFYIAYERIDPNANGLSSVLKGDVGYNGAAYNSTFNNVPQIMLTEMDKSVPDPEVHQYQNGTHLARQGWLNHNANNSNNFGDETLYVGARNQASLFFVGAISVMLIYNRVLTAIERGKIFNYFGNKFGIPVNNFRLTRSGDNRIVRDGSTRVTRA